MSKVTLKSGETLFIKEATRHDAQKLIEYLQIIGGETDYLSFGAGEFNKTLKEEQKLLADYQTSENQLYLYAELDGEIVSILDVKASEKPRIRHSGEFGISVKRAHWGKGIGGSMIEYMLLWAKATGVIKKLNLLVISNNESAINLYRKYDFSMEGRISKEFYVNGNYHDMISMGYWIE